MKFARHIQIFHSLYSQDEQEKNYTKGDVSYENLLNPTFAVLANFFWILEKTVRKWKWEYMLQKVWKF